MINLSKIFKQSKKGDYKIALDFGTEVVKAAIFKIDSDSGKVNLLSTGSAAFSLSKVNNLDEITRACHSACRKAEEFLKIKKMTKMKIRDIIFGAGNGIIKSKCLTVYYKRLKPSNIISEVELKDIISKVLAYGIQKANSEIDWETGHSQKLNPIGAVIGTIKIDGYEVSNPLGFAGTQIAFSIFISFLGPRDQNIFQAIARKLNCQISNVISLPYAISYSLKTNIDSRISTIIIDIGSLTTDVILMRQGTLEDIKSFNLGGHQFTTRLAKALKLDDDSAEKIKINLAQDKTNQEINKIVEPIFRKICQNWLTGIELSLGEFKETKSNGLLPLDILLCGGGSLLKQIKDCLSENKWPETIGFIKSPEIKLMQFEKIDQIGDLGNLLKSPSHIPLVSLINMEINLAKQKQNDIFNSLLYPIKLFNEFSK